MSKPRTDQPMDEMTLEASLKAVLTRQPDPAFVEALEQRLLASQRVAPAPTVERPKSILTRWRAWWAGIGQTAPRLRWAAVPVTVLALLLVALLAIGPERAWAGLQAWLGYVPGVGFVDLDESRLLARPARVTRGGVTLQVINVVAGPEDTVVVVKIEGLPPEDRFRPQEMPPSTALQPVLRLPGGETLTATGVSASRSQASFVFPALPAGVYRVTLEMARLPLVPEGTAPEDWEVALLLQPGIGELVAEMYPEPYRPAGVTDTHHGVTLSVLEVAHHPEETAVQMQLTWSDTSWELVALGGNQVLTLVDEQARIYHKGGADRNGSRVQTEVRGPVAYDPDDAGPAPGTAREMVIFNPVAADSGQLSLLVDGVQFAVPLEESVTIDLGDDPQIGDSWPLDVSFDVAGLPVHISGAQLVEERSGILGLGRDVVLQLEIDPIEGRDRRVLRGLAVITPTGFTGSRGGFAPESNKLEAGVFRAAGAPLPTGPTTIRFFRGIVLVEGPWEVTWQVPGSAPTPQTGGTLTQSYVPPEARTTQAGVMLSVLAAAHGEGETALRVRVHWNEPGREFLNGFWETEPQLRDEQGNLYERSWRASQPLRVTVEARKPAVTPSPPPGGYTEEMTLLFAPVPAGVETLTLEVEALSFHENASGELHLDLGPAPRVGQHWLLDETWTIGDWPVHVRGVQLLRGDDLGLPYELVFEMDVTPPDDGTHLIGLLLEADLDYFGSTSGNYQLEGALAPALLLPAIPDRPFTVSADAASLVVEGPWEVTWTVPR